MPTSKYHPYKGKGGHAARCALCVKTTPAGLAGWVEIHVEGEAASYRSGQSVRAIGQVTTQMAEIIKACDNLVPALIPLAHRTCAESAAAAHAVCQRLRGQESASQLQPMPRLSSTPTQAPAQPGPAHAPCPHHLPDQPPSHPSQVQGSSQHHPALPALLHLPGLSILTRPATNPVTSPAVEQQPIIHTTEEQDEQTMPPSMPKQQQDWATARPFSTSQLAALPGEQGPGTPAPLQQGAIHFEVNTLAYSMPSASIQPLIQPNPNPHASPCPCLFPPIPPAAGKAKVELLCMRVSLSDVVGMLNKQMPEYIRHHRLAHHQLQVFREHREAVKAGQDGKVVISCDWSEKLTVERSVEIMSEHWHAQQIGILVACAYFKNKEGAYKEHTVYVMTDGKEQSAAITQAAVNQVVCYLLAEHDMDIRQLYMWSDGCAGQFKGAPAMRQHWGMAQRFSMPVWWSYGATAHFKGRHDSEGGVVKQWLRGEILADRVGKCNALGFVQHCNAYHKPAAAADPSKAHRARASVGHRWCLELSTQEVELCSAPQRDAHAFASSIPGSMSMHSCFFPAAGIHVEWSETACACAQCMAPAPRGVCMRPLITKPFVAMPMFDQKRDDKHWDDECLTLLCSFAPDSVKQLCTLGKKLSVKMLNVFGAWLSLAGVVAGMKVASSAHDIVQGKLSISPPESLDCYKTSIARQWGCMCQPTPCVLTYGTWYWSISMGRQSVIELAMTLRKLGSMRKVYRSVPQRRTLHPALQVKAMGNKKRVVKSLCAHLQKGREVLAQRRAAEAEAKAQALAAEAEATAQADAGAYEAQLHQLQADLLQREQQVADTQRLQQLQQQMHDIQREEIQRKEQQVVEQQHQLQQQQADLHLREKQVAEQQHELQQQQADMHLREQQVAEQHKLQQQQQADMHLREQQVAEQHQLQHQLQGWVGKMDMRQLCLWSDGCASQFKGAKAIRLHWHLANRFGVPVQWSYGATSHFKSTHDSEGGVAKREWREQMLVHPELVGKVCGAAVLTDWANKHFAVPCHAQDTSASHRQRGHIMRRRYLVLDDARQATVCSMPEADVERMHDDVKGCRAMHRMVFTPDREQPKWAMAACACSTCMRVPCLPCMKPDSTTPLKPMPMFQDTVKEVREDEECYALLMLYHSDLLHDEVCFGKLTNKHCERYRMHMGWKRQDGRRDLRRLVLRELRTEELEAEYEADNGYGWV
ncbi:hypothetical protein QJQ45_025007 [Haematococcus lacustris]|nr:hypothetical protein QJQ45_025007 [Haematococcus lacustris]